MVAAILVNLDRSLRSDAGLDLRVGIHEADFVAKDELRAHICCNSGQIEDYGVGEPAIPVEIWIVLRVFLRDGLLCDVNGGLDTRLPVDSRRVHVFLLGSLDRSHVVAEVLDTLAALVADARVVRGPKVWTPNRMRSALFFQNLVSIQDCGMAGGAALRLRVVHSAEGISHGVLPSVTVP